MACNFKASNKNGFIKMSTIFKSCSYIVMFWKRNLMDSFNIIIYQTYLFKWYSECGIIYLSLIKTSFAYMYICTFQRQFFFLIPILDSLIPIELCHGYNEILYKLNWLNE